jgi:hypothetical protein
MKVGRAKTKEDQTILQEMYTLITGSLDTSIRRLLPQSKGH